MRSARAFATAAAAAAVIILAAPAAAQSYADVKGMDERFRLDLGGFFQQFDTTLRLDSTALGTGTEVNLEDDLGQDSHKTSFRANGYWRFGRHGRFDFGVLTWSRSATHTIARDIEFGDHVYHAGAMVDSKMTLRRSTRTTLTPSSTRARSSSARSWGSRCSSTRSLSTRPVTSRVPGVRSRGTGRRRAGASWPRSPRSAPTPGSRFSRASSSPARREVSPRSRSRVTAATCSTTGAYLDWYPWKNFGFGGGYSYMEAHGRAPSQTRDPARLLVLGPARLSDRRFLGSGLPGGLLHSQGTEQPEK